MNSSKTNKEIYVGNQPHQYKKKEIKGTEISVDGQTYYKISNADQMRPFFMSLVSHSDHWMFISSTGGLSAGRIDSDHALFPYYTDDKITESYEYTGSKTLILVELEDRRILWEPFSTRYSGIYNIERNLYKNVYGNKLIFEEINHDLALNFQYEWSTSERFGFVRQATLNSLASDNGNVSILDGIQNILPYGVPAGLQSGSVIW